MMNNKFTAERFVKRNQLIKDMYEYGVDFTSICNALRTPPEIVAKQLKPILKDEDKYIELKYKMPVYNEKMELVEYE